MPTKSSRPISCRSTPAISLSASYATDPTDVDGAVMDRRGSHGTAREQLGQPAGVCGKPTDRSDPEGHTRRPRPVSLAKALSIAIFTSGIFTAAAVRRPSNTRQRQKPELLIRINHRPWKKRPSGHPSRYTDADNRHTDRPVLSLMAPSAPAHKLHLSYLARLATIERNRRQPLDVSALNFAPGRSATKR